MLQNISQAKADTYFDRLKNQEEHTTLGFRRSASGRTIIIRLFVFRNFNIYLRKKSLLA